MSETFNGAILESRHKPIISMLKEIRLYVMKRIQKIRAEGLKWENRLFPKIVEKLDIRKTSSMYYHFTWNDKDGYEVKNKNEKFIVNMDKLTCTCRA